MTIHCAVSVAKKQGQRVVLASAEHGIVLMDIIEKVLTNILVAHVK